MMEVGTGVSEAPNKKNSSNELCDSTCTKAFCALRRMKMVCGDYNKCVNQIVIKPHV